ncbi:MAG: HlyD family type I secretion periplasmic adaptor subunit [Burkholderiales bacterium]
MYIVLTLFLILVVWSIFGKLDIIASAEGRLVPKSYVKIVQPADAGIVKEILVKEGETVKAGQILMRMDTNLAKADEQTLTTELALKSLQLRRIDAELTGQPLIRKSGEPEDLFRQVEAQYRDHQQSYRDALSQAREALEKAQRDYDAGKEVLTKLRDVTPILKAQADSYAGMGKGGYVAHVMVQDKQRDYLEKAQDLRAQESTVQSLKAAIEQSHAQVAEVTSKYRSELQNERIDAVTQYRKLQQEGIKQKYKTSLFELRAPQAGVVKDLATHTIGTVVSPGTVLLSIVPEHEPLVAEVMIKNDDVGFVFPQQKVKIKLLAYPFEKYGMLDGEVINIDPDASNLDPQQNASKNLTKDNSTPSLTYKALISLNSQVLNAQGEKLKIVPGMQVIAEINQGRRSVMEYLLSPVQKTLHDSGRER